MAYSYTGTQLDPRLLQRQQQVLPQAGLSMLPVAPPLPTKPAPTGTAAVSTMPTKGAPPAPTGIAATVAPPPIKPATAPSAAYNPAVAEKPVASSPPPPPPKDEGGSPATTGAAKTVGVPPSVLGPAKPGLVSTGVANAGLTDKITAGYTGMHHPYEGDPTAPPSKATEGWYLDPSVQAQWDKIQGLGAQGLEDQYGLIDAETARLRREQGWMNAMTGGQVGGAFSAGQLGAGIRGEQQKVAAMVQAQKDDINRQMAWLDTQMSGAEAAKNRDFDKFLQEEKAKLEEKLLRLEAGFADTTPAAATTTTPTENPYTQSGWGTGEAGTWGGDYTGGGTTTGEGEWTPYTGSLAGNYEETPEERAERLRRAQGG